MHELDDGLKVLDRLEPPDLWADIRHREPRRPASPEGRGRVVAIAVAVVVAAAGIALVARAFVGGTPQPSSQPLHPAAKTNGAIAFLRGAREPDAGIYVIEPDGTGARRLVAGTGANGGATWSPDGTRIAYTRSDGSGSSPGQGLFLAAADGSHARRLFECGARGCREPAWSPDGSRIAFVWGEDIFAVGVDGMSVRRLTHASTPLGDGHPAWSPDGTQIAFIVLRVQPYDLPGIFVMNADGGHVRPLTNCLPGCLQSLPVWSPDGRTIAFSGQTDVFVMDASGGPTRQLTDCSAIPACIDALDPTWSPDGRLIVFEVERDGGRRSLYLMNADGTGLKQVTYDDDDCCASWQPLPAPSSSGQPSVVANGEIWARVGGGDGPSFVYGVQQDGSGQTLLFSDQSPDQRPMVGGQYAWPPDGSRVAFNGWSNPGQQVSYSAIFVMNPDGSGLTQLTPDSEVDSGPAWSPDGKRIAYASDRTGPFFDAAGCWESSLCPGDIHVANADGTSDVQLTSDPADDSQPAWSPDGSRIAFISEREDTRGDVFVMNADGTGLTQLTAGPAFDIRPEWSPDGMTVAFLSYRDDAWNVYRMNPDGTGLSRLSDTGIPDSPNSFAWSPDGTKIAYTQGGSILVMNADGTDVRKVADFPAYGVGGIAWRPIPDPKR
jgi:Tol biopolymer transport system component